MVDEHHTGQDENIDITKKNEPTTESTHSKQNQKTLVVGKGNNRLTTMQRNAMVRKATNIRNTTRTKTNSNGAHRTDKQKSTDQLTTLYEYSKTWMGQYRVWK